MKTTIKLKHKQSGLNSANTMIISGCILAFAFFNLGCFKISGQTPDWVWAKSAGSNASDAAYAVTTDPSANIYIAGSFYGNTIIFNSDTIENTGNGENIFIVKYNSQGAVLWAKTADGQGNDAATCAVGDAWGNVYVAGYYGSTGIYFNDTIFLSNPDSSNALFIAKYDSDGNVQWAKSAHGDKNSNAASITADVFGNIYIAGNFYGTEIRFDSTAILTNPAQNSSFMPSSIFVVKYNQEGNLIWAKTASAHTGNQSVKSIAADASGNFVCTGYFNTPQFILGSPLNNFDYPDTSGLYYDMFILKCDGSGNELWAKTVGGSNSDYANSVALDGSGNIYVAGSFKSFSLALGSSVLYNASNSYFDILLLKYSGSGNLLWAKSEGEYFNEQATFVATDKYGNPVISGSFGGDTLFFGNEALTNKGLFSKDLFIAGYDGSGNVLWAKGVGGVSISADDKASAMATDAGGNVYVTGQFQSDSVFFSSDLLTNTDSTASPGDVFLARLSAANTLCDSLSVTDAEFDSVSPNILNITVFNESNFFLNYPFIDYILNASGDTVADGDLNFFGQGGNTLQTYQLSTSLFYLYGGDYIAYFNYNSGEQCVLEFSVPAPSCDSLSVVSMAPDPDSAGMLAITVFNQSNSIWRYGHIGLILNSDGDTIAMAGNNVQPYVIENSDSATFLLPASGTSLQGNFTLYFVQDGFFVSPPPCILYFNNQPVNITSSAINSLNTYPNPVNRLGTLSIEGFIKTGEEAFRITNNVGQIIYQQKIKRVVNPFSLDLSGLRLSPGIYYLILQEKEKMLTEKIVITQ